MERYDVSEGDRFAEMIQVARSGADVEITQDGTVVARLVAVRDQVVAEVEALRARLPAEARAINWSAAIRETRDAP